MKKERSISGDLSQLADLDAERAVLGSMLIDGNCVAGVLDVLRPEDFHSGIHQKVFRSMAELHGEGIPIDIMSVRSTLRDSEQLEEIGGLAYLSSLEQYVMTTANVLHHARIVQRLSEDRRLCLTCQEIASAMQNREQDGREAAGVLKDLSEHIIASGSETAFGLESVTGQLKLIEQRWLQGEDTLTGVTSGWRDLDGITLGFQPGNLVLLAARPSVGKSAFALNLTLRVAEQLGPVLFFSMEMSEIEIADRILALESKVPLYKIRSAKLQEAEMVALSEAAKKVQSLPVRINDKAALPVQTICSLARQYKREHPDLCLVVVDYLQLATATNVARKEGRTREVSEISARLKQLARDLGTPILALSQLSRDIEKRGKAAMPQLSDLRESGSLEQDADMVLFLCRRAINQEPPMDSTEPARVWVRVAKHRNGPTGELQMLFDRGLTRFLPLDRGHWQSY